MIRIASFAILWLCAVLCAVGGKSRRLVRNRERPIREQIVRNSKAASKTTFRPRVFKLRKQKKSPQTTAALAAPLAAETAAVVAPAVVAVPSSSKTASAPAPIPPPTFIRVSGPDFVDAECLPIPRISGYNSFMLVEAAAGKCCGGRAAVDAQLDAAATAGLTYVRFFAFAVLDSAGLQTSPGNYDAELLDGLDYVVASAGARGLKLLAVLANNWDYSSWKTRKAAPDSKCGYTNATLGSPGAATGCDDFFSNEAAKTLFKRHLQFITSRVNKYTGLAWRDDPTIFANGLINEPRCESNTENCAQALQGFIEDTAAALRSFDPNHLITVGEDGFFGEHSCLNELANPVGSRGYLNKGPPGSGWPLKTGQDVASNHASDDISFISVHLWSDNWARPDPQFIRPWLRAQAEVSRLLRKPVLLEEFGKVAAVGELWKEQTEEDKFRYYRKVYDEVAELSGQIKGILFWRWGEVKTDGDLGDFDKGSMVSSSSRIFQDVIAPFSRRAATMPRGKKVAGCKVDTREVPFAVVGGVAVPRAPGAPGVPPPAAAATAGPIAKGVGGGAGSASERVAIATASPLSSSSSSSAEQQPAASVAGRRKRRGLSAWADIDPTTAPVSSTPTTMLAGYLPPPALSAGPWMGSGQKISAGALRWELPPGSGSSSDNATVRKADGEAPPLPPQPLPPPKEPVPAKDKKKPPPPGDSDPLKPTIAPAAPALLPVRPLPAKEEVQPAPPKPPLPAATPPLPQPKQKEPAKKGTVVEEPAAEKTAAVPARVGGKIDARALNARISCANLQL